MKRSTVSERALILAPRGRDAGIAAAILGEAGLAAEPCPTLPELIRQLDRGAAFVVCTEEALATADLTPLAAWLADQEEWSDLPFVLLTSGGGGLERNPAAKRFLDVLGNVTFLERPFHPTTLVSLARSALRGRRRQYEARARLEALRELNETLERRVAEALAERRLFAEIVEGTDAFVQVADLDFRWLAINRAAANEFERVFGVRPKAGDSMLDVLAGQPEHRAAVEAIWSRALAGEQFTEVAEFGDPGRDRRCYEMKFNVLRGPDGERIGAYQFVYDVTDRVREQAELAEAQDALRQAQKMEAVGQLTGGVAHDFNNLLTIIKSSTDLLRRPDLAEERRRRYVDAISDTVDRAARLTGQLLAFARRQALKPEVFNVADRIQAITEMLGTIVGSRIQIVADVSDEPCRVMADASQFETALVNMAVNARDAMDGEGRLTVRVHRTSQMPPLRGHDARTGPFVCVSLADTGSGIAAERLGHIFEPFYTTKEVGKGTGLGLSQVFGFAKQSGGDVAVESEVGRGATFTLYLPRVEGEDAREGAPPASVEIEEHGRGRRVLVVEDNVEVGRFSTQILQDLGYETEWAANADEALKLLAEADGFDVVFSDVVMPGMSGVGLGELIRQLYPDLPVVLTSGYSHVLAEEGRHGFELLHKPYAVEDLSRVLRRVTRGGSEIRAAFS